MMMKTNPADAMQWVEEIHECPVCGAMHPRYLREGLAMEDVEEGKMWFETKQPVWYVECTQCGHCSNPRANKAEALKSWYRDVDSWELDWFNTKREANL